MLGSAGLPGIPVVGAVPGAVPGIVGLNGAAGATGATGATETAASAGVPGGGGAPGSLGAQAVGGAVGAAGAAGGAAGAAAGGAVGGAAGALGTTGGSMTAGAGEKLIGKVDNDKSSEIGSTGGFMKKGDDSLTASAVSSARASCCRSNTTVASLISRDTFNRTVDQSGEFSLTRRHEKMKKPSDRQMISDKDGGGYDDLKGKGKDDIEKSNSTKSDDSFDIDVEDNKKENESVDSGKARHTIHESGSILDQVKTDTSEEEEAGSGENGDDKSIQVDSDEGEISSKSSKEEKKETKKMNDKNLKVKTSKGDASSEEKKKINADVKIKSKKSKDDSKKAAKKTKSVKGSDKNLKSSKKEDDNKNMSKDSEKGHHNINNIKGLKDKYKEQHFSNKNKQQKRKQKKKDDKILTSNKLHKEHGKEAKSKDREKAKDVKTWNSKADANLEKTAKSQKSKGHSKEQSKISSGKASDKIKGSKGLKAKEIQKNIRKIPSIAEREKKKENKEKSGKHTKDSKNSHKEKSKEKVGKESQSEQKESNFKVKMASDKDEKDSDMSMGMDVEAGLDPSHFSGDSPSENDSESKEKGQNDEETAVEGKGKNAHDEDKGSSEGSFTHDSTKDFNDTGIDEGSYSSNDTAPGNYSVDITGADNSEQPHEMSEDKHYSQTNTSDQSAVEQPSDMSGNQHGTHNETSGQNETEQSYETSENQYGRQNETSEQNEIEQSSETSSHSNDTSSVNGQEETAETANSNSNDSKESAVADGINNADNFTLGNEKDKNSSQPKDSSDSGAKSENKEASQLQGAPESISGEVSSQNHLSNHIAQMTKGTRKMMTSLHLRNNTNSILRLNSRINNIHRLFQNPKAGNNRELLADHGLSSLKKENHKSEFYLLKTGTEEALKRIFSYPNRQKHPEEFSLPTLLMSSFIKNKLRNNNKPSMALGLIPSKPKTVTGLSRTVMAPNGGKARNLLQNPEGFANALSRSPILPDELSNLMNNKRVTSYRKYLALSKLNQFRRKNSLQEMAAERGLFPPTMKNEVKQRLLRQLARKLLSVADKRQNTKPADETNLDPQDKLIKEVVQGTTRGLLDPVGSTQGLQQGSNFLATAIAIKHLADVLQTTADHFNQIKKTNNGAGSNQASNTMNQGLAAALAASTDVNSGKMSIFGSLGLKAGGNAGGQANHKLQHRPDEDVYSEIGSPVVDTGSMNSKFIYSNGKDSSVQPAPAPDRADAGSERSDVFIQG